MPDGPREYGAFRRTGEFGLLIRRSVGRALLRDFEQHGVGKIELPRALRALIKAFVPIATAFFEQNDDEKSKIQLPYQGRHRGYVSSGRALCGDDDKDLGFESFILGAPVQSSRCFKDDLVNHQNVWPAAMPEFREKAEALHQGFNDYFRHLCHTMEEPVCGRHLELREVCDLENNLMAVHRYRGGDPLERKVGFMDEHTDCELFSILWSETGDAFQARKDGRWQTINQDEDSLIICPGELFEFVTGRCVKATPHRVVHLSASDRISIAFFPSLRHGLRFSEFPLNLLEDPKFTGTQTVGNFVKARLTNLYC